MVSKMTIKIFERNGGPKQLMARKKKIRWESDVHVGEKVMFTWAHIFWWKKNLSRGAHFSFVSNLMFFFPLNSFISKVTILSRYHIIFLNCLQRSMSATCPSLLSLCTPDSSWMILSRNFSHPWLCSSILRTTWALPQYPTTTHHINKHWLPPLKACHV